MWGMVSQRTGDVILRAMGPVPQRFEKRSGMVNLFISLVICAETKLQGPRDQSGDTEVIQARAEKSMRVGNCKTLVMFF